MMSSPATSRLVVVAWVIGMVFFIGWVGFHLGWADAADFVDKRLIR